MAKKGNIAVIVRNVATLVGLLAVVWLVTEGVSTVQEFVDPPEPPKQQPKDPKLVAAERPDPVALFADMARLRRALAAGSGSGSGARSRTAA